jgi:beta-glucosidase
MSRVSLQQGQNTGRVEALLAAMTPQEKIGQLNMVAGSGAVTGPGARHPLQAEIRAGRVGGVLNVWGTEAVGALQRLALEESRLGIPLLFALDVIHGHRTVFPVPLAEACLFAPETWEQTAAAAAREAAADGIALTFAPMLDVARDPRWGRMVESPGEDPWVGTQFAVAKTRGFQGEALRGASSLAAVAKHLCAYGAVTAGREYASVDVSEHALHEIYLPPFAAAVATGVAAVMPALTDIAGVPMSVNRQLLHGWLRGRLGFEGVVISDYNAVAELRNHGVAEDCTTAAALALNAGIDIDMASGAYLEGLPHALASGLISMALLDASVRRVLRLKEQLGLFDDPYRPGAIAPRAAPARELARDVARRAIVLLTHRGGVLPLSADMRHIAVIGPMAEAPAQMLGPWAAAGRAAEAVSILQGIAAALPRCRIESAPGVALDGGDLRGVAPAIERCRAAQAVILCLGEDAARSGEAASRADLGLPGCQRALAEAALDLGKPVVAVLCSGRPLPAPWLIERADAVLAAWFLGTEAGNAIADVLTGSFNPAGKLAVTWPRHVGQVPIFYAERPSGRPSQPGERFSSVYLDIPATPQFAFGHGLSYSRFMLEDLQCTPGAVRAGENLEVSVTVCNAGPVYGETTVFLFVRDVVATIARPVLELKGVRRAALGCGERSRLVWRLPAGALAFIGPNLEPLLEPGRFQIHVGLSAEPGALLSTDIELTA